MTDDPELAAAPAPVKQPRGFARMTREQVRALASAGGKAAHAAGTAHTFSSDEARIAGRAGGKARHVRRGRTPMPKKES